MILKRNNQNVGKCYTNFWKKLKSITVNIEICIHEKYGKDNKAFSVICESEGHLSGIKQMQRPTMYTVHRK